MRKFLGMVLVSLLGCSATSTKESPDLISTGGGSGVDGRTTSSGGKPGAGNGGTLGAGGDGSLGTGGRTTGVGGGDPFAECDLPDDKALVSLTYDDSIQSQLDIAVPALDSHGFQGTFFVTRIASNASSWAALLPRGHELGAHTYNHPCPASNSWVPEGNANEDYDFARMADELDEQIAELIGLGAPAPLTFAYPCGVTYVGSKDSYIPLVEERFVAARGTNGVQAGRSPDFGNVPAFFLHNAAEPIIDRVQAAQAVNGWVVLGFHSIGEGVGLSISEAAHEEVLRYLDDHSDEVHVAPFGLVARCLREGT